MKINSDYLQFFSFYISDEENNRTTKDNLKKIFSHKFAETFILIKKVEDIEELEEKVSENNHFLDFEKNIKVINWAKSHDYKKTDLTKFIEQNIGDNKNKVFYQIKLKSGEKGGRIICMVLKKTLYPLIFDLNHCVYKKTIINIKLLERIEIKKVKQNQ